MNDLNPIKTPRKRLRRMVAVVAWVATLAAAFVGGAYAYRDRARIRALFGSIQGGKVIQTNLYNLGVVQVELPAEGRDGGIAAVGTGVIFVNRRGAAWYIDDEKVLHPLAVRAPINLAEFEADPYNANTTLREQFAVKDILVLGQPDRLQLLLSHNHWFADRDCYVLRVSSLEASLEEMVDGAPGIDNRWKTVHETRPCRELALNPNGVNRNPTIGAGGRLAAISNHEILLTVGGFGPETLASSDSVVARDPASSYGKTIRIDLRTGDWRVFSVGHRNPQGLAVASDSRIWETEHAARGGDELNRIIDGRDYGYPMVSYGTEYESMVWALNPRQGRHDGFEKPAYAWVPSIGVSQLAVIEKPLFRHWQGDLMVSSLRSRSLFRVRLEDDRVVVVEPIPVEHRVRDIVELADGTLALKSDANFLIYLRPLGAASAADPELSPATRGQLLAGACSGCHTFEASGPDGIGPSLWGVVGRRVGSRRGFAYTESLLRLGGSWSPATLRGFISNPDSAAPGTAMPRTAVYGSQELNDLLAYLETLR